MISISPRRKKHTTTKKRNLVQRRTSSSVAFRCTSTKLKIIHSPSSETGIPRGSRSKLSVGSCIIVCVPVYAERTHTAVLVGPNRSYRVPELGFQSGLQEDELAGREGGREGGGEAKGILPGKIWEAWKTRRCHSTSTRAPRFIWQLGSARVAVFCVFP